MLSRDSKKLSSLPGSVSHTPMVSIVAKLPTAPPASQSANSSSQPSSISAVAGIPSSSSSTTASQQPQTSQQQQQQSQSQPIKLSYISGKESGKLFSATTDFSSSSISSVVQAVSGRLSASFPSISTHSHQRLLQPVVLPSQVSAPSSEVTRLEIGLENLGNTCFANSSIQCLLHVAPLVQFFIEADVNACVNRSSPMKGDIASSFSELVRDAYKASAGSYISPLKFLRAVSIHAPHLLDNQQQDCQEFLRFILDGMCEDLCRRAPANKQITTNLSISANASSLDVHHSIGPGPGLSPKRPGASSPKRSNLRIDTQVALPAVVPPHFRYSGQSPVEKVHNKQLQMVAHSRSTHKLPSPQASSSAHPGSRFAAAAARKGGQLPSVGVDDESITDLESDVEDFRQLSPMYKSKISSPRAQAIRAAAAAAVAAAAVSDEDHHHSNVSSSSKNGGHGHHIGEGITNSGYAGGQNSPLPLTPTRRELRSKARQNIRRRRLPPPTDLSSSTAATHKTSDDAVTAITSLELAPETGDHRDGNYDTDKSHSPPSPTRPSQTTGTDVKHSSATTVETATTASTTTAAASSSAAAAAEPISAAKAVHAEADKAWNAYLKFNDSVISDMFAGQLQSTIECQTCGGRSYCFDPFLDLSVPIPKSADTKSGFLGRRLTSDSNNCTLEDCLEKFLGDEILEHDNMVTCTTCNQKRRCVKRMSIYRYPPVLVIHIKRFRFHNFHREKLLTDVNFPIKGLDLSSFLSADRPLTAAAAATTSVSAKPSAVYDLVGVSNHSGNMSCGHYIAHINTNAGIEENEARWMCFNDTRVSLAQPTHIAGPSAYVLFYRLRGGYEDLLAQLKYPKSMPFAAAPSARDRPANNLNDEIENMELNPRIAQQQPLQRHQQQPSALLVPSASTPSVA